MSNQLLRVVLRTAKIPQRCLSSTAACNREMVLDQKLRDEIHPKIGNRDIVGFGHNGNANYVDRPEFPAPAIRFKESDSDVMALRKKEEGDWKGLSLEDKKALYRASFCQTYTEMEAPTGDWKSLMAAMFFGATFTGFFIFFMRKFVYPPPPRTITSEWKEKSLERMIAQEQGLIQGVASKWDYDKNEWKN